MTVSTLYSFLVCIIFGFLESMSSYVTYFLVMNDLFFLSLPISCCCDLDAWLKMNSVSTQKFNISVQTFLLKLDFDLFLSAPFVRI